MVHFKNYKVLLYLSLFLFIFSCKQKSKNQTIREESNESEVLLETIVNASKIGKEYALETQKLLGKNLVGAIQKKGVLGALDFCNVQAIPLTDSIAKKHGTIIKRVSDRPRNIKNKANSVELAQIEHFKKRLEQEKEVEPVVISEGNKNKFYYPIITNAMCLQCHGTPNEEIAPATLSKLEGLYPDDKAIGYGPNEVRGIWSITFK